MWFMPVAFGSVNLVTHSACNEPSDTKQSLKKLLWEELVRSYMFARSADLGGARKGRHLYRRSLLGERPRLISRALIRNSSSVLRGKSGMARAERIFIIICISSASLCREGGLRGGGLGGGTGPL